MRAATLTTAGDREPARGRLAFRSKRLLALAGDERLVEQIRRGNELAFEVAFERHGGGILGFCRHMLGSSEEAEDAVQHTFAAAFRDLQRESERQIALKPWLYTIARNRCFSLLRSRREHPAELAELPTDGLHEQVERRVELRELLADLRELPEEQRAALLLAEAADLSHAEVAGVLGCEVARVKALVFRARTGLIERREGRETPCSEIREQLATLRGGSLRRSELRHHLRHCPGCSEYREQVRHQRQMLAAALPVVPSMGLKSSVLTAAGLGGGAAGGGAAAAGLAGGGVALGGSLGSGAIAKVALVGALAAGGLVTGEAVVERVAAPDRSPAAPAAPDEAGKAAPSAPAGSQGAPEEERSPAGSSRGSERGVRGKRRSAERSHGRQGAERRAARSRGRGTTGAKPKATPPGQARAGSGGRKLGHEKRMQKPQPPPPSGPVQRAAPKPAPQPKAQAQAPAARSEPRPVEQAPRVRLPKAPSPGTVKSRE